MSNLFVVNPLISNKNVSSKIFGIISLAAVVFLLTPQVISYGGNREAGKAVSTRDDDGRHYNRLINEKSPYLLQHAENPVEWFAWGEDAFALARKENKPIFLSIGYSTCHWCHVMAHESFEDAEVARLLNDAFICIKVDREERPDIDNIYMAVCQLMTGSGGWPLTIFMTPEKKPFYAGTYFPKESRYQRPGMVDLIPRIKQLWNENGAEILKSADEITARLQTERFVGLDKELDHVTLNSAYNQLTQRFDAQYGGFGRDPKFPSPQNMLFLLRYWKRTGNDHALRMVEDTLRAMRLGGIYDHVGYGFHRYSTDREWLVPHFEKMLYDQAMLAIAYTETFQATGKDQYGDTAREIFTYVMRDMTSGNGGFYSAEDADSEGVEGKFYVWTEDEIRQLFSGKEADILIDVFNIETAGNYREGMVKGGAGNNILHLKDSFRQLAGRWKLSEHDFLATMDRGRETLFKVRSNRIYPHKDDKILTDWNGLMIAALAKGARVFGDSKYETAAVRSAEFILNDMRRAKDGRLLHRFRDGEAAILANMDDYAFFIWGLLELYETTFDVVWLQEAIELNDELIKHFRDEKSGGFFFTADDGEELLFRQKEIYDGAIPSGNSVAMLNLLRLGRITAKPALEEMAMKIGAAFAGSVRSAPSAHAQLMVGLDFGVGPSYELVIAGDVGADDAKDMLRAVRKRFIPNKVVIFKPVPDGGSSPGVSGVAPFTKGHSAIDGRATAYVCRDYSCKTPTTSVAAMLKYLGE